MTSTNEQSEEMRLQAFPIRHLSVLCYAQSFTLWHYKADNAIAFTTHSEWHGSILSMMVEGDRLMVSAPNGAADFVVRRTYGLVLHPIQHTFWEA